MKFLAIKNGPTAMSVHSRCNALGVTEQGYYEYLKRQDSVTNHAQRDEELAAEIIAADKDVARTERLDCGPYYSIVESALHDDESLAYATTWGCQCNAIRTGSVRRIVVTIWCHRQTS
jgi:hypothetical protein